MKKVLSGLLCAALAFAASYTMAFATPDAYESNNTFGTATPVSGILYNVIYANLDTQTDVDYYSFHVYRHSDASLMLVDMPEGCSYKVQLYRAENGGYTLVSGDMMGEDEYFDAFIDEGDYIVEVSSISGYSDNNYALQFSVIKTEWE